MNQNQDIAEDEVWEIRAAHLDAESSLGRAVVVLCDSWLAARRALREIEKSAPSSSFAELAERRQNIARSAALEVAAQRVEP